MSDIVTLEQVEALAVQLPQEEQVRLVEHIQERLRSREPALPWDAAGEERARQERLKKAQALIAELDAIAEGIGDKGEFDSAKDLREIRDERADRP